MAQPTLNASSVSFGGLARPNGQGVMSSVNLNDHVFWYVQDVNIDYDNRQIGLAQFLYRAQGTYLSDDFGPLSIKLPMQYQENSSSTSALGAALSTLFQAGEQNLSFDGLTQIPARLKQASNRKLMIAYSPFRWELDLEFIAKTPWWSDVTATTVAQSASTSQSITYSGSVFALPSWTFTVPNTNTATISNLTVSNLMSGEACAITFNPVIPASTATTVTINAGAVSAQVTDQNGVAYDWTGAVPKLYGPTGQAQSITYATTAGSGVISGATLGATYSNRWQG